MDKEYTAKIKLGISTDSWDSDGKIISSIDVRKIETEEILDTISHLKGDFNQTPPIFSAIKYKGKPAYYYARKNEEIKLKSKMVKIYDISLLAFYNNELILKINCSSGTYIRSIANEIGKTLGCGAVLTALRRDKIGNFYLDDSTEVESLENDCLKPGMSSQEMLNLYRLSIISLERLNII
jgi:tRNA pseudouridine55 synthase